MAKANVSACSSGRTKLFSCSHNQHLSETYKRCRPLGGLMDFTRFTLGLAPQGFMLLSAPRTVVDHFTDSRSNEAVPRECLTSSGEAKALFDQEPLQTTPYLHSYNLNRHLLNRAAANVELTVFRSMSGTTITIGINSTNMACSQNSGPRRYAPFSKGKPSVVR